MIKSTLIYIKKDNKYLMLFRNKKEKDINKGKWIGIGGKLEIGETPENCAYRECKEETGLTLHSLTFHGVVHFFDTNYEEDMYLYTSDNFTGDLIQCDEGTLDWIDINKLEELPIWEGDKVFLKLLRENKTDFDLTLRYEHSELKETILKFNK